MQFHIITIFPKIFNSYFNESIIKRAREKNIINIKIYDLRDWAKDRHKTVDDSPYGGGAGMIMKINILYQAIADIKSQITNSKSQINPKSQTPNVKTILLSAKGKTWSQPLAREYTKLDNIILICGRYEGVDERITHFIDEEISIGDYILTGGEIPAMAIIDSTTRLLPKVLGNPASLNQESFNSENNINHKSKIINHKLEYPQYTRPEIFIAQGKTYGVPKILLSGNHAKIKKWREEKMKKKKI